MSEPALILTLLLDPPAFERLDGLRRAHFPPAINHIPAHLTLFHHLPGARLDEVTDRLTRERPGVMRLRGTGWRKLGRGVALAVEGGELSGWRAGLAHGWSEWLTAQDRQPFRPHVTVQNKVEPEQAAALHEELQAGFEPFDMTGEGVAVWRYLGGPWRLEAEVRFRQAP